MDAGSRTEDHDEPPAGDSDLPAPAGAPVRDDTTGAAGTAADAAPAADDGGVALLTEDDAPPVPDDGDAPRADEGDPDGSDAVPGEPLLVIDDPDHPARTVVRIVSWAVVALCCIMVAVTVHPEWILRTTTPTGGDMGAHVWGPQFLRDHLLPNFRLTGWSPDWYAGFPAYVFYMVIPSLVVVLLNVGPPLWLSPFLLAALAAATWWVQRRVHSSVLRTLVWIVVAVLAVLCIPVPYNVSFKIVTVAGLVTMPLAGYALGKAARLPFPGPPLLAIGAAAFLYETGFTILGGNIASTMAGEFAFSISLTLAVLYLAVLHKGMRTGREKALGAVLFGLVILCHLIPAIFAALATVVLVLTRREDRTPWWDASPVGRGIATGLVVITLAALWLRQPWFPLIGTIVAVLLFVKLDTRVVRWAAVVLPVGFLVSAFWFIPFYLNSPYLNDMGWEKYTEYAKYLWPDPSVFDMPYRNVVFALAGLGVILSLVHRVRLGWYLTLLVVALAWTFRFMPQYRLWNARILPFYYLCLYLLAALAVVLVIRSLALVVTDLMRRREEPVLVSVLSLAAVFVVVVVAIGGALRVLPGGQLVTDPNIAGGTTYRWLGFDFAKQNISGGWALYNYQGLEGRPAYPEYKAVIDMMDGVGKKDGCGRAMWEYEPKLDRFGTPMALMLLPHFTDGCIGSMEGLYFEASSTTPFHFLNQSELSVTPSRAQRDLPYGNFDMDLGISHLQLLGVKYYMATTQQAIDAARKDPRLTEVASTGPWTSDGVAHTWVAFEVADTQLVTPMKNQPVVLKGTDDHIDGWVYGKERAAPNPGQQVGNKVAGPATTWYLDRSRWGVPLATSGPPNWDRVDPSDTSPPVTKLPQVKVSDIQAGTNSISFHVDKVGVPVLVKASYFPNWQASGAEGPYRVSPNQMVVIPTEKDVSLSYGTTWVDWLGWLMTAAGLALVGLIAVREERSRAAGEAPDDDALPDPGSGDGGPDGGDPDEVDGPGRPDDDPVPVGAGAGDGPAPPADTST
jgi:hypothetical protein